MNESYWTKGADPGVSAQSGFINGHILTDTIEAAALLRMHSKTLQK